MNKFMWAAWAWSVSGALHMVVGGYICYRFRSQIDAVVPVVEKIAVSAWKKIAGR